MLFVPVSTKRLKPKVKWTCAQRSGVHCASCSAQAASSYCFCLMQIFPVNTVRPLDTMLGLAWCLQDKMMGSPWSSLGNTIVVLYALSCIEAATECIPSAWRNAQLETFCAFCCREPGVSEANACTGAGRQQLAQPAKPHSTSWAAPWQGHCQPASCSRGRGAQQQQRRAGGR